MFQAAIQALGYLGSLAAIPYYPPPGIKCPLFVRVPAAFRQDRILPLLTAPANRRVLVWVEVVWVE